jgi:hypothetical protein
MESGIKSGMPSSPRPSPPPPVRGGSEAPLWPEGRVEMGVKRGISNARRD